MSARWHAGDNRGGDPEPGLFLLRMVRGGPDVPARIAQTPDGWWYAEIAWKQQGDPHPDPACAAGVYRIWHGGVRCGEAEHQYLTALRGWAEANDPRHPLLHPTQPINIGALAPVIP